MCVYASVGNEGVKDFGENSKLLSEYRQQNHCIIIS